MPARHRYKCLNFDRCPVYNGAPTRPATFIAMNAPMPECPNCGSRRLEDWGEAIETNVVGAQARTDIKNSDANLRRVAARYGMTNMSNKDGKSAKGSAASKPAIVSSNPEATINIGGYQVPLSQAASGSCVHMPGLAKPMSAAINQAAPKSSAMIKKMTNIVGEHKA